MAGKDNSMKPMLTVTEVARLLHLHSNTVRRWSDRGLITAYRIGQRGDRRFTRNDIAAFLAEKPTGSPNNRNNTTSADR